jgi:hypothetical protein
MINIKIGMNRSRLLNSNLLCNSDKLKIVSLPNLSIDNKSYHTKVDSNKKDVISLSFLFLLILSLLNIVIYFIAYIYSFDLLNLLEQSLFILFFFFLTIFYLDEFKLSNDKGIKYSQIIVFILFIIYIICFLSSINFLDFYPFNNIVCQVNSDDIKDVIENKDITIKGKVVLDKEAGTEVAKGLSNLGSNIGLGACVGAMAGGVAKAVVKSPLPPMQKAGLVIGAGLIGAVIHTGASAINAQTHAQTHADKSSTATNQTALPKDVNQFIDSITDYTPLEILLQCIYILNSICI